MLESFELYASCAQGLEGVLATELKALKAQRVRPLKGGVSFYGDALLAQKACLWLRSASRVELVIGRGEARDAQGLYEAAMALNWQDHLSSTSSIKIHASGTNESLKTSQFVALKTKDALCDYWVSRNNPRPSVDLENPEVRINVHLNKNRVRFSLDLSGESLHKRGYRSKETKAKAPLKENLAAGLLLLCDYHKYRKVDNKLVPLFNNFIDPLCGTGTLTIEAALIACNGAPGLLRKQWGFFAWKHFDAAGWNALTCEAELLFKQGKDAFLQRKSKIYASDKDVQALNSARECARRAGVIDCIRFSLADVETSTQRFSGTRFNGKGLVVTNPPYAIRLGDTESLAALYDEFLQMLNTLPGDWELGIISADTQLPSLFSPKTFEEQELYNGPHKTQLYRYKISDLEEKKKVIIESLKGRSIELLLKDPNAHQFASRLRKCAKERKVWAQKQGLSAYRIYDKDLPDFALSVDLYFPLAESQDSCELSYDTVHVCVSEYKAPQCIDEYKAQARMNDAIRIIEALFDINSSQLHIKVRQKSQGGSQYTQKEIKPGRASEFLIQEFGHQIKVNLSSFLDTGIFLDHRACRWVLQEYCTNKSLLNLFSYTCLASLHAACKGACTTNLDLSQTYLRWGMDNYKLNNLAYGEAANATKTSEQHVFIRADVLTWIKEACNRGQNAYDCIFLDPPTFSNSKAMHEGHWDVQRDYGSLIRQALALLNPDGVLIFSCNLRNFKFNHDDVDQSEFIVKDFTEQSIPYDFKRSKKIHHCYAISRNQEELLIIEDLFNCFNRKETGRA